MARLIPRTAFSGSLALLAAIALSTAWAMAATHPAAAVSVGPPQQADTYDSSMFAVNIDPSNEAAWQQSQPGRLASEGFQGVRFVSRQWIQPRIDALKAAGLSVMAIITGESGGYVPWNADFIQIGNEPDLPDTYLSPSAYADMWVLYRNTYPQFAGRFVMAGLASGGQNAVNYATAVFAAIGARAPLPDIIAIHPYAKNTSQAAGDFDMMWNNFGRPVIATEWHNEDDTWNFQCMLAGRSSVWNSVFAYTDAMVDGFGLRDGAGNPKPFYYSLLSAPATCR
ncbi:glycosyl hydrolase [Catellatospora tritici]|uniref:glycosyl hydrolase n=1 Tax=Catellatospora tritici TaxID=2851566 RepID=UPI001C2D9F58|nr:glycosyl hydrolase [Catellatospora tritici]MBV1854312.1 hypothetical protein [Catellatospora tritici]